MEPSFRKIEYSDYHKRYFDLLSQLTVAPVCNQDDFDSFVYDLTDNHIIFVLENDQNRIIASGTVLIEQKLIRNMGKVAHIEDIVVDKESNGKGIGKKLINKLTEYAKEQGCYKVILDCRDNVVPFYEKCGFVKKESEMALYF
jgi:glucosamine-phosphate N-acetyltransferase